MMQADLNWRLIVPGATQEEEEERYRNQRGCRCCCDGAHREKASFYSLVLVLLLVLVLVLLVLVLVLLLLMGALGWFDLTGDQKLGTSPDSTLPDYEALTSALQGGDLMNWPSAMLTAPRRNNNDGKYLQWESNEGHAFCHGGFNYSDRALVVPKKGIYRVFLQITYEGDDCSEPEINLYSRVFVHSERYPLHTALLSASDIVKCGPWTWRKSLYSAGLHKLEAKSRLHVNATHRSFLAKNEDEVFFGAQLVQQLPPSP